jgi:outer membrane protein OmpA-like peptidoglycan-associated protein
MVSGMLTAIRDFAQDSFRVSGEDSLEQLKVGDLAVWIEAGPHAILAAVVRGSAPREFHHVLQSAVEQIHLEFGEALENFSGDASALNGALPILEECLRAEYRQDQRSSRKESAWLVVAVVVVALLAWAGFSIRRSQREARYVNALRAEPGITVVSTSREGGKFVVSGLRDPLARDPQSLVAGIGLDANDVAGRWSPYYSLDPAFVVARSIADVTRRIERRTVLFEKAAPTIALEQSGSLQQLVDDVKELDAMAEGANQRFRLILRGHADTDGVPESNQPLSRARALAVHAALAQVVSQRIELVVIGAGSRQPAVLSQNEQDKQRNRRVTIQVERLGS